MRVLVVEDEKKIAGFIRRGLREEGYTVDVCHDGREGLELVRAHEYDLILLDLMLPGLDGIAVCREIRGLKPHVALIMVTARDQVKDKVVGLDAGADDYLAKPFAFAELLARIRAVLRAKNGRTPARVVLADLEMDPVSHAVTRGGQPIELTSREFALLEFLLRNVGTVVTRTMIAEHVWDQNFDSGTNVIDVYITYLRRKIDKPFPQKLIHTIKGRGYILRAP